MGYPPKFVPRLKKKFLEYLRQTGNVSKACRLVGVQPCSAYDWKKKNEKFAKQWDDAVEEAIDGMEDEAYRRAIEGVDEPVFYQGKQVAIIKKYSDTVLLALLAAHRPERWGRRIVDLPKGLNANITIKWQGDDSNNGPV